MLRLVCFVVLTVQLYISLLFRGHPRRHLRWP